MAPSTVGMFDMSDNFYRAFEDKFRGSGESIKSRLSIYQPFLEAVRTVYPKGKAIYLGCNRGE